MVEWNTASILEVLFLGSTWLFSLLLVIFVLAVRTIRWLALVQQKEYRVDRLLLFLRTAEGRHELIRLIEQSDFRRTTFKRPQRTLRLLATAAAVLALYLIIGNGVYRLLLESYVAMVALFGAIVVLILLVPVIVLPAAILPSLIFEVYAEWKLTHAALKLATRQPLIIGITGSYGKTGTKFLLAHILRSSFSVFIPPRSYNTVYSVAESVLKEYGGEEIAIIEYAAYRTGEIARLARKIQPEIAILTGLAEQHVGLFGSLRAIATAKSELVRAVIGKRRVYVSNTAAEGILAGVPTTGLELHKLAQSRTVHGSVDARGQLQVQYDGKKIQTKLVGLQYIEVVRTAVAVAADLGVAPQKIADALQSFSPPMGFTTTYSLKSGAVVLDDGGTSNPAGFAAVLELTATLKFREKILLTSGIVDLGDESAAIHTALAKTAERNCTEVWHLGSAGVREFRAIARARTEITPHELITRLGTVTDHTLIVIEGRMPGWLVEYLRHDRV